jgi:hypothetical protein
MQKHSQCLQKVKLRIQIKTVLCACHEIFLEGARSSYMLDVDTLRKYLAVTVLEMMLQNRLQITNMAAFP